MNSASTILKLDFRVIKIGISSAKEPVILLFLFANINEFCKTQQVPKYIAD